MKAIAMLNHDGLIKGTVLLGNPDIIHKNARSLSVSEDTYRVRDSKAIAKTPKYRDEYRKARNLGVLEDEILDDELSDPVNTGAILLRMGEVDGYIAGLQTSTAQILKTGINVIKPDKSIGVITSFSLMHTPTRERRFKSVLGEGKIIILADPIVNIDPSVGVLYKVAEAAADYIKKFLGIEPRIAFLSYSTKGSGQGKTVDKMRISAERTKQKLPGVISDGELQLDAAIMPEIAKIKAPDSPIKGNANILIFPNLDAANIGSKLIQLFGNARILGPIIYGLNKPFNDVSRGANEYDIYDLSIITQLQVT